MRTLAAVAALLIATGCGSTPKADPNEPTTAREKQMREAKANGELDSDNGKWGGWKYQGDRDDCFFVVGRKCYKTEKLACNAARCKTAALCDVVGGGPATVSCKKPSKS
jgi:hypothetical protein|nr:hypothetical protein [Kofleriaceae bacterium]